MCMYVCVHKCVGPHECGDLAVHYECDFSKAIPLAFEKGSLISDAFICIFFRVKWGSGQGRGVYSLVH